MQDYWRAGMAKMRSDLVLGSGSAVRARLLRDAGVPFDIDPADVDEAVIKRSFRLDGLSAEACALALAEAKARHVASRHRGSLVVGADQILVVANEWLDKPVDLADLRMQLQKLQGRPHALVTAAVVIRDDDLLWRAISTPLLSMRRFTDRFLDAYIAVEGENLLGSVGGYQLEGRGAQLFNKIEGDYFAVLGLPLIELLDFLRQRSVLED